MTETGEIRINGVAEPFGPKTVAALLDARGIDPARRGIAVALNGAVVPRRAFAETPLAPGDAVEIIQARQGG